MFAFARAPRQIRNTPNIRLSRQEQWERPIPVIERVKKSGEEDFLLNKFD
jgi:hypothetical protein